jgi:hypothetical protein
MEYLHYQRHKWNCIVCVTGFAHSLRNHKFGWLLVFKR